MSTDHVVEAIDNALTDWELSPDAMRWTTNADAVDEHLPPFGVARPFITLGPVEPREPSEVRWHIAQVEDPARPLRSELDAGFELDCRIFRYAAAAALDPGMILRGISAT